MFNVDVSLDPKPIPGDWNGAGGHTNYSTKSTRTAPGGYDVIVEHCKKLEKAHALHIAEYGEGNERRLTGKHEACFPPGLVCAAAFGHLFCRGAAVHAPRSCMPSHLVCVDDSMPLLSWFLKS